MDPINKILLTIGWVTVGFIYAIWLMYSDWSKGKDISLWEIFLILPIACFGPIIVTVVLILKTDSIKLIKGRTIK